MHVEAATISAMPISVLLNASAPSRRVLPTGGLQVQQNRRNWAAMSTCKLDRQVVNFCLETLLLLPLLG